MATVPKSAGYKAALNSLRKRAARNNRVMDSILGLKNANKQRRQSNRRSSAEPSGESAPASPSSLPQG